MSKPDLSKAVNSYERKDELARLGSELANLVLSNDSYQGTGAPWPSLLDKAREILRVAKGE